MLGFLVCILVFALSSCKKDDDKLSPLVGTWSNHQYTYIFNADGTGMYKDEARESDGSIMWSGGENYTWSANEVQLNITYTSAFGNSGYHIYYPYNSLYYYTINGNSLNIYYDDGGLMVVLTRSK